MRDHLDPVRALLPATRVDQVAQLRGSERSSVVRVRLRTSDSDRTAIVKQFRGGGEGWVRETAALATLATLPRDVAPRVLAADRASGIVVMADLGDGPTLADALLGHDRRIATLAVDNWATELARLHSAARPLREQFAAALAQRQGDVPVTQSLVSGELSDAARAAPDRCMSLGVPVPAGAMDALRALGQRLGGDGASSLSPVDACPDDAVLLDGRYRLVDYEGAQWRHIAWDVAYLQVPWPTCWCAWRLPVDVARRAVDAYRRAAEATFPEAAGDGFERDLAAATAGWAMTSVTWFLDSALRADTAHSPDRHAPSRRATVLNRLALTAGSDELPALAELAAGLYAELRRRWGDVELPLAPAFRSG